MDVCVGGAHGADVEGEDFGRRLGTVRFDEGGS